jgi:hypothetical protein
MVITVAVLLPTARSSSRPAQPKLGADPGHNADALITKP